MVSASLTSVPARAGDSGPRPAMLVLPGGGYAGQADHEAEPVAEWLATLGIHAYVLRYRVAPHRHPAPLEDAKEALLRIRNGSHGVCGGRRQGGSPGLFRRWASRCDAVDGGRHRR